MCLYMALLFVLLVPGLVLRLPPNGSLLFTAIVHALVFVILYSLTNRYVQQLTEGFDGPSSLNPIACKYGWIRMRYENGTLGKMCAYSLPTGDFCRTDAFCQSKSCDQSTHKCT